MNFSIIFGAAGRRVIETHRDREMREEGLVIVEDRWGWLAAAAWLGFGTN